MSTNHQQHECGLPPVPGLPEIPGWFSYSGRYTRAQFWIKYLAVTIPAGLISFVLLLCYIDIDGLMRQAMRGNSNPIIVFPGEFYVLMTLLSIVTFLISFPLVVKRFHDINISGWVPLGIVVVGQAVSYLQLAGLADPEPVRDGVLQLVSYIVSVAMLVILCLDSTRGTNKYGPSYKYPG